MKKNNSKKSFGAKIKRFFKHYFALLLLAIVCSALMVTVLFFAFA